MKRDKLKAVLDEGRDPRIVKKRQIEENAAAAGTTFEKAARTWHAHTRSRWSSIHADDVIRSLERDVFPAIVNLPISDITPRLVLEVLRAVEGRGAMEIAHRLRQRISASFVYAIAQGWVTRDPAEKLDGAGSPVKRARLPLIADLARLQKMIRDAEADSAPPIARCALRFIALTAVRPNEVQSGAWREYEGLDSPEPLWRTPAWRMQGDRERMIKLSDHLVPLARQSVEILRDIWPLTGGEHYIFPSARDAHLPMSADAISSLLRRAGYHGFNVWPILEVVLDEYEWAKRHGKEHDPDVIELMISYTRERSAAGTCNRLVYMLRRRELAQIWADMLCEHLPEPELLMDRPSRAGISLADDLQR